MSFSQGKITSFLYPWQQRKKDVGPEIKLKAQRIMSGIRNLRNVLKGAFSSVNYIIINPQMKLITEQERGRVSSSESSNKIK